MKRPIFVIGLTFLLISAVNISLSGTARLILGAVSLLCLLAVMKKKQLRKYRALPVILAACLISVLWVSAYTELTVSPAENMQGKTACLTGKLCELPYVSYGRYYYEIEADKLTGTDSSVLTHTKILVSSAKPLSLEPYDTLTATVSIHPETPFYRKVKGIMLTASVKEDDSVQITPETDKPLYYYFLMLRSRISERLDTLLSAPHAEFLSAFFLGEKTRLSPQVKNDLQDAGLSHIVVVSGLHLTILTRLCMMFLMGLLRRRRLSIVLCEGMILLYMALTGFSPSILRAGIMQLVMLSGELLLRDADPPTSLSFSALLILLFQPYAASDISLLLSFFATLGILLLEKPIRTRLMDAIEPKRESRFALALRKVLLRFGFYVCGIISVYASAMLFSAPLTILYFRRFALYGLFYNLLVTPLLPLLMIGVVLMLLLSLCGPLSFLSVPFAYLCGGIAEWIMAVSSQVSKLPFAVLEMSERYVPVWLAFAVTFGLIAYFRHWNKRRLGILTVVCLLMFVCGAAVTDLIDRSVVKIAVLNTGGGISVILPEEEKAAVLSCGGNAVSEGKITEYLRAVRAKKLSFLLLNNNRFAYSRYAEKLLESCPVGTAVFYDQRYWSENLREGLTKVEQCKVRTYSDKITRVVLENGVIAEILANWSVQAIRLNIHGVSALICQEKTDTDLLPQSWKQGDLLIFCGSLAYQKQWDYDTVIISDAEDNQDAYQYWRKNEKCLATYDGGNIIIRISNDNKTEIRREEQWLS